MRVHLGKAVCECETVCIYYAETDESFLSLFSSSDPPPLHHHSQCTDLSQTVFAPSLLGAAI